MSLLTNLMHLNKQNNTLNSGVCDLRTCKDANYASRNLNRSALWTCSRCDLVSLYFRTESKLSRLRSSHLSSSHPSVKPNGPEKQQVKRRVVPWHQASFLREFRLQRMPAWQEGRGEERGEERRGGERRGKERRRAPLGPITRFLFLSSSSLRGDAGTKMSNWTVWTFTGNDYYYLR